MKSKDILWSENVIKIQSKETLYEWIEALCVSPFIISFVCLLSREMDVNRCCKDWHCNTFSYWWWCCWCRIVDVCLAFSDNNNRNNRQSVFHLIYSILLLQRTSSSSIFTLENTPCYGMTYNGRCYLVNTFVYCDVDLLSNKHKVSDNFIRKMIWLFG